MPKKMRIVARLPFRGASIDAVVRAPLRLFIRADQNKVLFSPNVEGPQNRIEGASYCPSAVGTTAGKRGF